MAMATLPVKMQSAQYDIVVGLEYLSDVTLLAPAVRGAQIFVITSKSVQAHYADFLASLLAGYQGDLFVLPDGEQGKTLTYWSQALDQLIASGHYRDTTVIAFGGGVVTDLAGFVAATYMRGVRLLSLPTTVLAQVDASVGGKTAVNHEAGKNLIGAFYQPYAVFMDCRVLQTLSRRECLAGFAEVVKAALIADAEFFTYLEANVDALCALDLSVVQQVIIRGCEIKRDIVLRDPEEQSGVRYLLNLGHSFAHAIEHVLSYGTWLHGEAVSVGLVAAAGLSVKLGLLTAPQAARIKQLLQRLQLPVTLPAGIEIDLFLQAMDRDKKNSSAHKTLVLLNKIGSAQVMHDVPADVVTGFIADELLVKS